MIYVPAEDSADGVAKVVYDEADSQIPELESWY